MFKVITCTCSQDSRGMQPSLWGWEDMLPKNDVE